MPTPAPDHTPDHTPNNVAYGSRQGQPAPVSPALAHQLSLAELHSEFAALKNQLAAQAAEITTLKSENASLKSAIPNPQSSPSSDNLQSSIGNLQSPSPANPAFAPLYAREVPHFFPGGKPVQAPVAPATLSRQAHLERLNLLTTRCELALVEKTERFAVFGIIGSSERDTFEFILLSLARLTSIYKSIAALENDPTLPIAPVQDQIDDYMTSFHRAPSAPESSATQSPSNASDQSVGSVQSIQSVQSDSPQSETPNPQSSISNLQSSPAPSTVPAVPAVPSSPTVQSAPAIPAIRQVPQVPTYSPERLVQTLDQTATALNISSAGILPAHSSTSANPHTPTQSPSPSPSQSESSSVHSVQPVQPVHSTSDLGPLTSDKQDQHVDLQTAVFIPYADPATLANLPPQDPDPPCPLANTPAAPGSPNAPRPQCTECDAEICPSRIAVPVFTGILKRTRKCDGACRFCSSKRQKTCPYTLPKYRDGPKM